MLTRNALGEPYEYRYTGASQFFVGQVDFTHPDAFDFYGDLLDEAVGHGYDGWMEDFGEYTPLDAHGYDGSTGEAYHNNYVVGYHAAARAYARDRAPRPLARFNRSGWTGAAQHSQIVWGGDPTTSWGFDGLESAVKNGLTMGLSGVSLWGSDIGGFFALSEPQTTPELLARWIEFGFASGVMRTQANGFALHADAPRADLRRRTAAGVGALREAAHAALPVPRRPRESEYDRTGMPLMRHLALAYPGRPRATAREDEYLLGRDLLVAPVVQPGRARAHALPAGRALDRLVAVDHARRRAARRISARRRSSPAARDVTLPAPLDELPLLVREGAVIPLLDPSVETLADYGEGTAVRLRDRDDRLRLLAWPRGRTTARARRRGSRGAGRSRPRPAGAGCWRSEGSTGARTTIQAALGSLRGGAFRPCAVRTMPAARRPVEDWSYDEATGVLEIRLDARNARVVVRRSCARADAPAARRGPSTIGAMSAKVKICGITRLEDARLAVDSGAWAIGMIFHPDSPRHVEEERAAEIATALRRRCEVVGVFVNAPLDDVLRTLGSVPLTMLQLHGDEGPSYCAEAGAPQRPEGDQGGAREGRARRALAVGVQDRLPHDRRLRARAPTAAPANGSTGSWRPRIRVARR